MLYKTLKFILSVTLRVFFRKIYIRNKQLIPETGPMIICANHPATFLDPLVIGVSIKPELFFLAKGEAFKSPLAKWLLPKLNMIPVYRQQDDPSLMHKNKETFVRCYEHLEKGGVIVVFPEGLSLTERKLRKLKTGTARIALSAEARNDFKLGLKILNIGINYTDPHRFNKDLFLNIDTPIEVSAFKAVFAKDEHQASNELTEQIRESLEKHIIAIEDEQTDQLVQKIETIYKQKLGKDIGLDPAGHEDDFQLTRKIVDTVTYFKSTDPQRVEGMRTRVNAYFDDLQRAKLSDSQLNPEGRKESFFFNNLLSLLFVLAGFPLYVYGLVNNILAFEIPSWISRKFAPSTDFVGAIAVVSGTFCFALFYSLQCWMVQHWLHQALLTVIYLISLPISGFFAYLYWYIVKDLRSRWLFMSVFFRKTALISGLIKTRMEIIEAFDAAKGDYEGM
jgi:glycerol-3-phosphate O-acyltransferase/dihydroxyacetone phosphate acyltransferase